MNSASAALAMFSIPCAILVSLMNLLSETPTTVRQAADCLPEGGQLLASRWLLTQTGLVDLPVEVHPC